MDQHETFRPCDLRPSTCSSRDCFLGILKTFQEPCHFVIKGLYVIDLRQHSEARLISDAAVLNDIPETLVGSRVKHGIEYRPGCVLRLQEMDEF